MYRYPDGTFKQRLPKQLVYQGYIRNTRDLTLEQLNELGYNEAQFYFRPAFTSCTTEWVKDGLIYKEQLLEAIVDVEMRNATLAAERRAERDRLLLASDRTQLADAPLTEDEKIAWQAYRQALRDVPRQPDFPLTVTWPLSPDEEL